MDFLLTGKLEEKFPKYFKFKLDGEQQYTSIQCGDGWYSVIDEMCDEIRAVLSTRKKDYHAKNFKFFVIKEKFGTLRVYSSYIDEEVRDIIYKYEEKSKSICENCGNPGKMRNNHGWYMTLCDNCNLKLVENEIEKTLDIS